jgi:hypothetical protein
MIDQIGGWLTQGVGSSYGNGYPTDLLHAFIFKSCADILYKY